MYSGLPDIWVINPYQPHGFNDHLANGRSWGLDQ